jgi:exonuclease SbcD
MTSLKLLHTSDWHLGHTLHEWDREQEHATFLAWLLDLIEADQVEVLLIAGDVFETSNPPASALATWYRFLGSCRDRFPALEVVVIGGNHDAASRLEAANPLLSGVRVHVVGGLPPRVGGALPADRLVIPVGREGQRAWVCAVPFLRAPDLGGASASEAGSAAIQAVYEEVLAAARSRRGSAAEPLVAMGHVYMVGTELSRLSERQVLVGNQHALPPEVFPADVAYAALGHLHKPQLVGDRHHVRYSGSPLPLSLSEAGHAHQVLLVELEAGGVKDVQPRLVPRQVEIRRFGAGPGAAGLPLPEVLRAIEGLPARGALEPWRWPWVEVQVLAEKPLPGLMTTLQDAMASRAGRLVHVGRTLTGTGAGLQASAPSESLRTLSPAEVFRRRYESEHRGEPAEVLLAAFQEAVELASQEVRP